MGFSRQESWSGSPFPSPGGLPNPAAEPLSPALAGGFFTTEPTGKPLGAEKYCVILLYEALGAVRFTESESTLVDTRGWAQGDGGLVFIGHRVSV